MIALSLTILALLSLWIFLFPFTGDGDSVLHYFNARNASRNLAEALSTWSRPGYTIPLSFFAPHGIVVARLFSACITIACAWQTVRLAEDLRLPGAWAAAFMLLFQTPVFALAADTMTEMALALGVVVAVRLWLGGWLVWSGLVVGFLPLFRPEGFFFGAMWGVMVLCTPRIGWGRKGLTLLVMTLGLAAWAILTRINCSDWAMVWGKWSWPLRQGRYLQGPWWYYAARWPDYCGLPLLVLFVRGLWRVGRQREKRWLLVAGAWLLVFGLHSILFWRGWFASYGLVRLLACVAPMTAVICLRGWGAMRETMPGRKRPAWMSGKAALAGFVAVCGLWALGHYCVIDEHYQCFPMIRCARFIRENHLPAPGGKLVCADQIVSAVLDFPPYDPILVDIQTDRDKCWHTLRGLPGGSIVVWDNRQTQNWFVVTTEELKGAGFTELHGESLAGPASAFLGWEAMRYVVLRKDGEMAEEPPRSKGK